MTCKTLISIGAASLALVAAAPAAADDNPCCTALYPETVNASGVAGAQATVVRVLRGGGSTARAAFTVRKNSLVFGRFRSLHVTTLRFGSNDATLKGVGLLNGRRVAFTAHAIHNNTPGVDVLRVSLAGGASLGGRVGQGSIFIR